MRRVTPFVPPPLKSGVMRLSVKADAPIEKPMNRIKIIKRADANRIYAVEKITEQAKRRRANEGLRKAASVVSDWIGELREQKQKDAETALAELFRFKSLSPDCRAC